MVAFTGIFLLTSKNRLWVIRNRSEVRQYAIREENRTGKNHYTFPANVFSISEDKERTYLGYAG